MTGFLCISLNYLWFNPSRMLIIRSSGIRELGVNNWQQRIFGRPNHTLSFWNILISLHCLHPLFSPYVCNIIFKHLIGDFYIILLDLNSYEEYKWHYNNIYNNSVVVKKCVVLAKVLLANSAVRILHIVGFSGFSLLNIRYAIPYVRNCVIPMTPLSRRFRASTKYLLRHVNFLY